MPPTIFCAHGYQRPFFTSSTNRRIIFASQVSPFGSTRGPGTLNQYGAKIFIAMRYSRAFFYPPTRCCRDTSSPGKPNAAHRERCSCRCQALPKYTVRSLYLHPESLITVWRPTPFRLSSVAPVLFRRVLRHRFTLVTGQIP